MKLKPGRFREVAARKRRLYAWALLLALGFQRIIGLVGSEMVYVVQVSAKMNATEVAIADKLRHDTGLDVRVEVQDDEKLASLLALGYSTPFVFVEEIDGQVCYYTVANPTYQFITSDAVGNEQSDEQLPQSPSPTSKEKLIADFYFWRHGFLLQDQTSFHASIAFLASFWRSPLIDVTSPPPEMA